MICAGIAVIKNLSFKYQFAPVDLHESSAIIATTETKNIWEEEQEKLLALILIDFPIYNLFCA